MSDVLPSINLLRVESSGRPWVTGRVLEVEDSSRCEAQIFTLGMRLPLIDETLANEGERTERLRMQFVPDLTILSALK